MKSKLTTKKERIQDLTSALRDLGIEKAKIVRHGRRSLSSSLEPLLYDFQPFCFKHLQFRAHDHRPMAVGQSILKDNFLLAEFSVVLVYGSIIHILQQIHHLITLLHDSFFSTALDKWEFSFFLVCGLYKIPISLSTTLVSFSMTASDMRPAPFLWPIGESKSLKILILWRSPCWRPFKAKVRFSRLNDLQYSTLCQVKLRRILAQLRYARFWSLSSRGLNILIRLSVLNFEVLAVYRASGLGESND